jgi:hypothetical protein
MLLLACTAPTDVAPDLAPPAADTGEPVAVEAIGEAEDVDPSDFVFDPAVVHRIDLAMDEAAWQDISANYTAENWQTADFAMDGEVVAQIGVRAFGAGSQSYGKTPLKLSFDRVVAGQEYRGLEQLKLDSSTQDAGFLNDPLAAWVLRELGLPAARSGWVEVFVNGALRAVDVRLRVRRRPDRGGRHHLGPRLRRERRARLQRRGRVRRDHHDRSRGRAVERARGGPRLERGLHLARDVHPLAGRRHAGDADRVALHGRGRVLGARGGRDRHVDDDAGERVRGVAGPRSVRGARTPAR